jgi:hypothetical protein
VPLGRRCRSPQKGLAAKRGLGAFAGRMQWNWVYEMVVIISGLDDGQWYQGTESMWVQISLELPGLPITRETSNDQQ